MRLKPTIFFFLLMSAFLAGINAQNNRASSAPYISGDTFRSFADFIFDEEINSLLPKKVRHGDVIFVKVDLVDEFIRSYHPKIKCSYILITHNGDLPITEKYKGYLNEDNLIIWFAQNVTDYVHPKLRPIPIGLANRYWTHGNVEKVVEARSLILNCERDHLLYMNFSTDTYPKERQYVYELMKQVEGCFSSGSKDFQSYLNDLSKTKFVVSPRGNGLDTHRTWEALYIGAIPIVKSSSLDPLFQGLSVLVVDDWSVVNKEYLDNKWEEFKCKEFNHEKLFFAYWENEINSYRNR